MADEFPRIEHSLSATQEAGVELCTVFLDYAEGCRAEIRFNVRDRLRRGDTDEAWTEELRRVARALQTADR